MNKLKRLQLYKEMQSNRDSIYLCRKLGGALGYIRTSEYWWSFVRRELPELRDAILNSPYRKHKLPSLYWFNSVYYRGWVQLNAELAIRDAVLEEAIKNVPPLTWWDKCFIW